jgi:cyclohexyl-isocyanide hydratase
MTAYTIGIPIVTYFDLMDVANPYEIFCWLRTFAKQSGREVDVQLIGHERKSNVTSFNGAALQTHASFDDMTNTRLDVLFVPGGGDAYIDAVLADAKLLEFVRSQAATAQWVSSVCTGAFILAAAGLLNGVQATTHWLFLDKLQQNYPAVQVVNGFPRLVIDGKFMTGGGISSGIDEALTLAGKIGGDAVGRQIELSIQYRPQPPYGVGDPSVADYPTWKKVTTDLS